MRALLIAVALLAGCSIKSMTPVTPAGSNKYMIGAHDTMGMESWTEIKARALTEASAYCDKQGKQMAVETMKTHGARGWSDTEASLVFRCDPK